MNTVIEDIVAYFDVDETIVLWHNHLNQENSDAVEFDATSIGGGKISLVPHKKHIEKLKQHKSLGHGVVVWSAGGALWAKTVVETLGLTDCVDVCLTKPRWFYDDISGPEVLPEIHRVYYKQDE